jgi:hypothetical protein
MGITGFHWFWMVSVVFAKKQQKYISQVTSHNNKYKPAQFWANAGAHYQSSFKAA